MEQKEEIEVLVAGPEHEVYVDTILQNLAAAVIFVAFPTIGISSINLAH